MRSVAPGPDTVGSSQAPWVIPLPAWNEYPGLLDMTVFLIVIMKCQEGLNYSLQTTRLERMWKIIKWIIIKIIKRILKKCHTGVAFWFVSTNWAAPPCPNAHLSQVGFLWVYCLYFGSEHPISASARGERERISIISDFWCGKRTQRICLFPTPQTGPFGNISVLFTFRVWLLWAMWGNLKGPGGVGFPWTARSAGALICVGDSENPARGAKVTLKAENQILSLISVCFHILFELCNYYTSVTSACVLEDLWEVVEEKHVFQGESWRNHLSEA